MSASDPDFDWDGLEGMGNYRPRRAHRKSRNGCADCKRRRIKCDENRPRCSRCTKLDQPCNYPTLTLSPPSAGFQDRGHSPISSIGTETSLSLSIEFPTPSPEGSTISTPATAHLNLSPEDSDLFIHFLQHTSHISGLEPESQYAWRLGLPTLAIKSPTVMHSALAVSAMCLCMDIISAGDHLDPQDDFERISHLTAAAIAHHTESIREVGAAIAETDSSANLDVVLANAAIMVPYGFMLRRIKAWLFERMFDNQNGIVARETAGMSWIYLCRMVKTAIWGLRDHHRPPTPIKSEVTTGETMNSLLGYINPRSALSPITHILYPIMSATASAAISKLQTRVVSILGSIDSPSAAACIAASGMLGDTVASVVVAAQTTNPECTSVCQKSPPQGHLIDASPWLHAWLIAHPHLRSSPHRGLEKLILAYLNAVSDDFIDLLSPILDRDLKVETDDLFDSSASSRDRSVESESDLTPEQLAAAEIFVHWLVLLMLLENTWWVGDLGLQELTKLVSIVKGHRSWRGSSITPHSPLEQTGSSEPMGGWWPESLLNVALDMKRMDLT